MSEQHFWPGFDYMRAPCPDVYLAWPGPAGVLRVRFAAPLADFANVVTSAFAVSSFLVEGGGGRDGSGG